MDKWSNRPSNSRQAAEMTDVDPTTTYKYTPGQLPSIRQMWYSLCDVGLQIAADYLALIYVSVFFSASFAHPKCRRSASDRLMRICVRTTVLYTGNVTMNV